MASIRAERRSGLAAPVLGEGDEVGSVAIVGGRGGGGGGGGMLLDTSTSGGFRGA